MSEKKAEEFLVLREGELGGMEKKSKLEIAIQNVMGLNELEFGFYDVVMDCINPETGKPLVNFYDPCLKRFLTFRNNHIDYDADASLEANVIYKKVFPFIRWMETKEIRPQRDNDGKYNRYGLKYELKDTEGGASYRGDTINSVATTNRVYYRLHPELQKEEEFPWPTEAEVLMDTYHNPGNFMLLPYRPGLSINQSRGVGIAKDYFDLYLLAIYNFFREVNGRGIYGDWTLEKLFGYHTELVVFMQEFLWPFIAFDKRSFKEHDEQFSEDYDVIYKQLPDGMIPGWDAFVKQNFFQDFVKEGGYGHMGMPKELWKGHFENAMNSNAYVLPQSDEECFAYWKNATGCIYKRAKRIYDALHREIR